MSTPNAPYVVAPFNQAVVAGDLMFISGQLGMTPGDNKVISGGIRAEAEQALTNLGEVLKAAGADYKSVVKVTIIIDDIKDFDAVNEIYKRFFDFPTKPSRAVFQGVPPKGSLIEIEAVAIVDEIKEEKLK